MVWASVHRDGSTHPPHVHSDSMVRLAIPTPPPSLCSPSHAKACAAIHCDFGHNLQPAAQVTGTYYSQVPADCSPIVFDDPRGRSPFDVMVGIENQLRSSDTADADIR